MLDPVLEKLIYFPSKRVKFQPTMDDIPLTIDQVESITSQVEYVSRFSGTYSQLIAKHIYNKLNVIFCVQRVEDIPAQHLDEVFNFLDQVREELAIFRYYIKEQHRLFASQILRGRDPWVTSVKANWNKKLTEKLPNRPDWNLLAKEIANLSLKGG